MRILVAIQVGVLVLFTAATAHSEPSAMSIRSVMDRRWSVGFSVYAGAFGVARGSTPMLAFGSIGPSARFRLRRELEVGVSARAGGAIANTISEVGLYADVRYRFQAEHRWNAFADAGVGLGVLYERPSSDVERQARATVRIGGGVERRFTTWGIEAGIQMIGFDENPDVPPIEPPTTRYEVARFVNLGAMLSVGVTKYL